MAEKVSATIRAEELPESLVTKLGGRPSPGTRFRVTAEAVDETDEEKLESLRADLREGRQAIEEGRVVDAETVFSRLLSKYPPSEAV